MKERRDFVERQRKWLFSALFLGLTFCAPNMEVNAKGEGLIQFSAPSCGINQNIYEKPNGAAFTYINSCYMDDALYLEESGDFYRIYVGGVEGWVRKTESNGATATFIPAGVKAISAYSDEEEVFIPNESIFEPIKEVSSNGLQFYSYSEIKSTLSVKAPSYYKKNSEGDLIHYVTKDVTVTNYPTATYSYQTIGKAPDWMVVNQKYYSYDGNYFYTSWQSIEVSGKGSVNEKDPYFNYYQYLPLRSKTNLTESDFNQFLKAQGYTQPITSGDLNQMRWWNSDGSENWVCSYSGGKWTFNSNGQTCLASNKSLLVGTFDHFLRTEDTKGVNALVEAVWALHESGWGRSKIALAKNNLFGMGAYDTCAYECAESYNTLTEGLNAHIDRYIVGYLNHEDWRYFGSHLGNKASGMNVKYASDPYWGEKIAGWYYRIDKAAGLKDYNYYTIGVKTTATVYPIYKQSNTGSGSYYQSKNKSFSIKNYPFLITGESNGMYQVKTDTPLNASGVTSYLENYMWGRNYGYIDSKAVQVLNHRRMIDPLSPPSPVHTIQSLQTSDAGLLLTGYGYVKGINNTISSDIKQTITIENAVSGNTAMTRRMTNQYNSYYSQNSSHGNGKLKYDYAKFEGDLDLNRLNEGVYNFYITLDGRGQVYKTPLKLDKSIDLINWTAESKIFVLRRVTIDSVASVQLTVYRDQTPSSSLENYVTKMSQFEIEEGQILYNGYSYVKGINLVNSKDIIQKLKFTDVNTKAQVMTFTLNNYYSTGLTSDKNHGNDKVNYDWAKFKGSLDITTLPAGEYEIKLYTNAKGYKYDTIINFHSSVQDMSFETREKIFEFYRYGSTVRLKVTARDLTPVAVSRVSLFDIVNGQISIEGYSYVKNVDIPNSKDIVKKLKFTDVKTGKQVKTYTIPNVKIPSMSKDPNHGNSLFNYDWAKFKGMLDISDLPMGEYYLKIYTNAKDYKFDEVIAFHSSLTNFSFGLGDKLFMFERVKAYGVSSLKLTVKSINAAITEDDDSAALSIDDLESSLDEDVVVDIDDVYQEEVVDDEVVNPQSPEADIEEEDSSNSKVEEEEGLITLPESDVSEDESIQDLVGSESDEIIESFLEF